MLEKCGDNLTRANIMKQAASIKDLKVPMLIDGITINTAADDFYPIEELRLARFNGREWEVFGDLISAR